MLLTLALLVVAAIVFYWRLYLLGPSDDPFTRGPYLVRVDERSAELRWRTTGDSTVEVVAADPRGATITGREGRLTGLTPGTRYVWTASIDGGAKAAGSFATPSPDPRRPVRFSVLADYGDGSDPQWAVARTLAATRPQFVVTAGDNSYVSAASFLLERNIFRPMAEVMRNAPVYVGLGDHDLLPPDGGAAIREAFDLPRDGRHVVAHGPIQLVILGNDTGGTSVAFARRALAQGSFTHRFVVVHVPIRSGDPILPVLRAARVDAVFSGNLHLFERRTVDDVRTFTVGTGGAGFSSREFAPGSADAQITREEYGHLTVDVSPSRVVYSFVDQRGRVLDRTSTP